MHAYILDLCSGELAASIEGGRGKVISFEAGAKRPSRGHRSGHAEACRGLQGYAHVPTENMLGMM